VEGYSKFPSERPEVQAKHGLLQKMGRHHG